MEEFVEALCHKAGGLWIRFPMKLLDFSIIFLAAL
jgi:hypothetical protein